MSETEINYTCAFHPKTETQLRCNRCAKPICIKCATHTPTGYRCPECIRSQQKVFVTAKWYDQLIAAAITGIIAFLGSLFAINLGFYMILLAMAAGYAIVWAVKKAIRNRRSPWLKYVMSVSALLGSLIPVFGIIIRDLRFYGTFFGGGFYSMIWYLAYALILAGNVYYQTKN
jgi:hypothetical protein